MKSTSAAPAATACRDSDTHEKYDARARAVHAERVALGYADVTRKRVEEILEAGGFVEFRYPAGSSLVFSIQKGADYPGHFKLTSSGGAVFESYAMQDVKAFARLAVNAEAFRAERRAAKLGQVSRPAGVAEVFA